MADIGEDAFSEPLVEDSTLDASYLNQSARKAVPARYLDYPRDRPFINHHQTLHSGAKGGGGATMTSTGSASSPSGTTTSSGIAACSASRLLASVAAHQQQQQQQKQRRHQPHTPQQRHRQGGSSANASRPNTGTTAGGSGEDLMPVSASDAILSALETLQQRVFSLDAADPASQSTEDLSGGGSCSGDDADAAAGAQLYEDALSMAKRLTGGAGDGENALRNGAEASHLGLTDESYDGDNGVVQFVRKRPDEREAVKGIDSDDDNDDGLSWSKRESKLERQLRQAERRCHDLDRQLRQLTRSHAPPSSTRSATSTTTTVMESVGGGGPSRVKPTFNFHRSITTAQQQRDSAKSNRQPAARKPRRPPSPKKRKVAVPPAVATKRKPSSLAASTTGTGPQCMTKATNTSPSRRSRPLRKSSATATSQMRSSRLLNSDLDGVDDDDDELRLNLDDICIDDDNDDVAVVGHRRRKQLNDHKDRTQGYMAETKTSSSRRCPRRAPPPSTFAQRYAVAAVSGPQRLLSSSVTTPQVNGGGARRSSAGPRRPRSASDDASGHLGGGHYKMRLPWCVGTATPGARSHSVVVNLQTLLGSLKRHNPLCASAVDLATTSGGGKGSSSTAVPSEESMPARLAASAVGESVKRKTVPDVASLKKLLDQLEAELARLVVDRDLMQDRIDIERGNNQSGVDAEYGGVLRDALCRQLEAADRRVDVKRRQITQLRRVVDHLKNNAQGGGRGRRGSGDGQQHQLAQQTSAPLRLLKQARDATRALDEATAVTTAPPVPSARRACVATEWH